MQELPPKLDEVLELTRSTHTKVEIDLDWLFVVARDYFVKVQDFETTARLRDIQNALSPGSVSHLELTKDGILVIEQKTKEES